MLRGSGRVNCARRRAGWLLRIPSTPYPEEMLLSSGTEQKCAETGLGRPGTAPASPTDPNPL